MKHSAGHYAQALDELTRDMPSHKVEPMISRFLGVLRRERATPLLPRIIDQFEERFAARDGQTLLRIASSEPLSADGKRRLARACGLEPKSIRWIESRDASLISGARVRFHDRVLNVSLKKRLDVLEQAII